MEVAVVVTGNNIFGENRLEFLPDLRIQNFLGVGVTYLIGIGVLLLALFGHLLEDCVQLTNLSLVLVILTILVSLVLEQLGEMAESVHNAHQLGFCDCLSRWNAALHKIL